jgi:hypothetical protein
LVNAWSELRTDIVNNRHLIPNDGERYRNGEPIAMGFVESTANAVVSKRVCKPQQMAWCKEGAHLWLQTRARTLNGELASIFKRWYPDLMDRVESGKRWQPRTHTNWLNGDPGAYVRCGSTSLTQRSNCPG